MIQRIHSFTNNGKERVKNAYTVIKNDIQKRPLVNFYLAILALVLLIFLSNYLRNTQVESLLQNQEIKEVNIYSLGDVPRITIQAEIEKSGVIQIVALSGGVVQKVHYKEGETVAKGNTLISLSSNYQGGNAFSTQRQLAQTQYNAVLDTYDAQKELIQQQRNVATTSAENAEQLRKITEQSLGDTRSLISLNEQMLDTVNENIEALEQNPQADQTLLQSLQAQKAQLLAATSQARAGLRNAEYQASSNNPPAGLARMQRESTIKQLEIQEKTLNVNKEVARLQLQLANVTEGLMYPVAPLSGVVQRFFVKEFDVVSPGMPLVLIAQVEGDPIKAIAYVPGDIAKNVSKLEPSVLRIGKDSYEEYPYFISNEAIQGNSYGVYYTIPDSFTAEITEGDSIEIDIPVGYADSASSVMYIPIDAIYQTTEASYVFKDDNGVAKTRKVVLGNVYGKFVEVVDGLKNGDQIIVTRNVIDGDKIIKSNNENSKLESKL